MKVQHRQRLEITLDLFKGCAHHCSGCMIDKAVGGVLDDIPELLALIKEMVGVGYVAFDLGIGPTDYMTADNTKEVMDNPVVQEMAQLFRQVTINAAFLEKRLDKYTQMCEEIDLAIPGKPIRFLIPAAPSFFKTPKFGDMINAKLTHIKNTLKVAYLNEAGFVVNCTEETVDENFDLNMRDGFDVEFPVDKDDILNLPYGRLKRTDILTAERVKAISHRITQFYSDLNGDEERRRNPDLCFDTGTMVNLLYAEGNLYWVPFLKDDCVFFNENFVVPRPWSMTNLLAVREKAVEASLQHVKDTPCMTCPYLSSCVEKGITNIMHTLGIKDCLVGLEYVH